MCGLNKTWKDFQYWQWSPFLSSTFWAKHIGISLRLNDFMSFMTVSTKVTFWTQQQLNSPVNRLLQREAGNNDNGSLPRWLSDCPGAASRPEAEGGWGGAARIPLLAPVRQEIVKKKVSLSKVCIRLYLLGPLDPPRSKDRGLPEDGVSMWDNLGGQSKGPK